MSRYGWNPYVPVAKRRAKAQKKMEKLKKQGFEVRPVEIEGRKIARSFWGQAWCDHLESFSDYENRLPRGRTYVRNGSVCHLEVSRGAITALVYGTRLYTVEITIKALPSKKWKNLKANCTGQIGSLLELLQGSLSKNVMSAVTDRTKGLFPLPGEIKLGCSCPDWAVMCKHVAAVLYGVGARLDQEPELLFLLRGVDHEELISAEVDLAATTIGDQGRGRRLADDALSDVFGIDLAEDLEPIEVQPAANPEKETQDKKPIPDTAANRAAKHKTGSRKSKPQTVKASIQSKADPKKSSQQAQDIRQPTGKKIAGLRAKFGMSQAQFAGLLGVSAATIGNWEKKSGALNLQTRSIQAWSIVKKLGKRQAWRKLSESREDARGEP